MVVYDEVSSFYLYSFNIFIVEGITDGLVYIGESRPYFGRDCNESYAVVELYCVGRFQSLYG